MFPVQIYVTSQFINSPLLINQTFVQTKANLLTAHVLVSLKMGALCNADTTAMTAWRLFMSHSFCEQLQYKEHKLSWVYNTNITEDRTTMSS